jgi:hypothetical protein
MLEIVLQYIATPARIKNNTYPPENIADLPTIAVATKNNNRG